MPAESTTSIATSGTVSSSSAAPNPAAHPRTAPSPAGPISSALVSGEDLRHLGSTALRNMVLASVRRQRARMGSPCIHAIPFFTFTCRVCVSLRLCDILSSRSPSWSISKRLIVSWFPCLCWRAHPGQHLTEAVFWVSSRFPGRICHAQLGEQAGTLYWIWWWFLGKPTVSVFSIPTYCLWKMESLQERQRLVPDDFSACQWAGASQLCCKLRCAVCRCQALTAKTDLNIFCG